jgi:hypothetical protein
VISLLSLFAVTVAIPLFVCVGLKRYLFPKKLPPGLHSPYSASGGESSVPSEPYHCERDTGPHCFGCVQNWLHLSNLISGNTYAPRPFAGRTLPGQKFFPLTQPAPPNRVLKDKNTRLHGTRPSEAQDLPMHSSEEQLPERGAG